MIEYRKGDYVIANVKKKVRESDEGEEDKDGSGDNKMVLMKVQDVSTSGRTINGRLEKLPHINDTPVSVKVTDVVINLGKHPAPGKVYGFDVESLYLGPKSHDVFGDVHFFTNPDEASVAALWTGLDTAAKRLRKHGLQNAINLPCVYEVTPKHGKYAGMYLHSKNLEKSPHRIQVSVGEKTLESASIASYLYVTVHEIGHLLHFHCMDKYPKLNAKWIELYAHTIGPRTVEAERCIEIGKAVSSCIEGGLREYYVDADDEAKADLKLILKWIREVKSVTSKELDLLLRAESKSALQAFKAAWPKVQIQSKDLKPMVSEYACKNFRELFAEAFAFYVCGKELPKDVVVLMEKTLDRIRGELKNV